MTTLTPEILPPVARIACERLKENLQEALGPELLSLWAYGAQTFADFPKRLGDIDTHALLSHKPDIKTAAMIDEIHTRIATDVGIEWDSWYILKKDVASTHPPKHAFREHLVDDAWALHRAHWLAGQYVLLSGSMPSDFVRPPRWQEIEEDLWKEWRHIERTVIERHYKPGHAAYAIWNGCRIVYSLETRNVVISKRSAARWALACMPGSRRSVILAAGRIYDGTPESQDDALLRASLPGFMTALRSRITRQRERENYYENV